MELDDLDTRILALLQQNARLSYREIARTLDVSTPTVSSRVKRLEEFGVILGYHAEVAKGVGRRRTHAASLTCHLCDGPVLGEGVRARMADGRHHVFCCAICKRAFATRLAALKPR